MSIDKCDGCIFADAENYMTTTIPICTRDISDYIESVNARLDPEPCPWHITTKKIIELQDNGLL
jgi:hypothetical protein